MSDLHCPARVFVARHGDAEYETERLSDDGGSLSALGRRQARELGESLRGERIARVWCSSLARAVQTAEIAAAVLGTDVVVREGLREYPVGDLAGTQESGAEHFEEAFGQWARGEETAQISGGERVADTVARIQTTLQEIADQHRGEAVLVVSHGGAMLAALPSLAGLPREHGLGVTLEDCAVIELEADVDGWRMVSWCGEPASRSAAEQR